MSYDAANLCDGAADLPPEMGPYYECLATHSRCEGDVPHIGEGCTAPVVALETRPKRVAGPVDVPSEPAGVRGPGDEGGRP